MGDDMDNDMNNNINTNVNEQPTQSNDKRLREMYDKLVGYEKTIHEQNQKRIKIGLRCIYIIPSFSCAADDCAGQFKTHFSCAVDSESVCYRSVFNRSRVCGL